MTVIKLGNFKILIIKRMEKRTWEYLEDNRTPGVYFDQNLNSHSRQRLNEILLVPKCLPWVDVKGLFVLKNASVLIFHFSLTQVCVCARAHTHTHTHTQAFIGFILCVQQFNFYILYSSHLCNNTKMVGHPILSFLYLFLRVVE